MSKDELHALGVRAGGVREMVAPTRRRDVEDMEDAQVLDYLVADPARLRRPIIDTGERVLLGFTKNVREQLLV